MSNGRSCQGNLLDTISIISFIIGLMNLDENVTQGDKQELMEELSNKADYLLNEIHRHLQEQDEKIDAIIRHMEGIQ